MIAREAIAARRAQARERNRLAADMDVRGSRAEALMTYALPADWKEQLHGLGLEPGAVACFAQLAPDEWACEITGWLRGREIRLSATADHAGGLWPNLLRAFS